MTNAVGPSLRRRLTGLVLLTVVLAWFIAAALAYADAQREIDALLDAHLEQAARLLIAQAGHELEEIDVDDAEASSRYASPVAFQFWSHEGRLELKSVNAPLRRFSAVDSGFSDAELDGVRWRVFSDWDAERGRLIQVAEDHATRDRIARGIALNALLPLLVALPVLGLGIGWVVGRGLRPLRLLGEEVARRGPQDLEPLRPRRLPVELVPLASRLDGLFARIQASLASERRFTSHAAHELRTPIAAIRAQAEVAQSATQAAQRESALQHVVAGCDRAARLMEQLLLLARADELDLAARRVPCDLRSIAEGVLAELAPAALRAGTTVSLDAPGPLPVIGDATLLGALVRNLVDNAIRHGGPGDVHVRLRSQGREAVVEVEDSGRGVAEAELAQIGQRFYRVAGTRSSGSGLGLSIVGRVVELHEGSLRFGRGADDRGFRVEVRLPAPG